MCTLGIQLKPGFCYTGLSDNRVFFTIVSVKIRGLCTFDTVILTIGFFDNFSCKWGIKKTRFQMYLQLLGLPPRCIGPPPPKGGSAGAAP